MVFSSLLIDRRKAVFVVGESYRVARVVAFDCESDDGEDQFQSRNLPNVYIWNISVNVLLSFCLFRFVQWFCACSVHSVQSDSLRRVAKRSKAMI